MTVKMMGQGSDLFESDAEILVNAVNCIGVMGAGIAAEFKRRYPDMYEQYATDCEGGWVHFGQGTLYRISSDRIRYVYGLPTMYYPGERAQLENVIAGLYELRQVAWQLGVTTIAIPALGAGIGRLDFNLVKAAVQGVFYSWAGTVYLYPPLGAMGEPEPLLEVDGNTIRLKRVQPINDDYEDVEYEVTATYNELVGAWHTDVGVCGGIHWLGTDEILRWESV